MRLTIEVEAADGDARVGRVLTPRGELPTPLFMPVGTRGAVKTLSSADLEELGVPLVLGNTYHLMLRPGADVVERLGGLHGFMDWSGHVLTDSGGYQVFSLEPKVDDDGATFRSTYDGTTHRLTPEDAVRIQESLGADIQMALDVCPPLPAPDDVVRQATDRTHLWAERARAAFLAGADRRLDRGLDQAQFGICQCGADHRLRAESAKEIVSIGFDGYAIGGLSVGETRDITLPALAAAIEHLPADQPRYFMGLGDPVGIVEAVGLGVDMFDCVLPTRLARHGTILTSEGRYHLKGARFETDERPLDVACGCLVCQRWSRGYLRHLLRVGEPSAPRLLTWHNVSWTQDLVARLRAAIRAGTYASFRAEVRSVWE